MPLTPLQSPVGGLGFDKPDHGGERGIPFGGGALATFMPSCAEVRKGNAPNSRLERMLREYMAGDNDGG